MDEGGEERKREKVATQTSDLETNTRTYHFWAEVAMRQFTHKSQSTGLRLPEQILLNPLNGLHIVLQEPANKYPDYVL